MRNMKKKPLTLIFLGRSGSGKGTQAVLLKSHFKGIRFITTGDLFRKLLKKKDSETARKIKKIVNSGGLAPHWLASFLWTRAIIDQVKPQDMVVFDGAPRRLDEAKLLDEILEWYGRKPIPILVDISSREAVNRLTKRKLCKGCGKIIPYIGKYKDITVCNTCGGKLITRKDDAPSSIKKRLSWYNKKVKAVEEYYKSQGRLKVIDGEQSIAEVFNDILKINPIFTGQYHL